MGELRDNILVNTITVYEKFLPHVKVTVNEDFDVVTMQIGDPIEIEITVDEMIVLHEIFSQIFCLKSK